jgi:hypothetical protein
MSQSNVTEDIEKFLCSIHAVAITNFGLEGISDFVRVSSGTIILQLELKINASLWVKISISNSDSCELCLGSCDEHREVLNFKVSMALLGFVTSEVNILNHEVLRLRGSFHV